MAYKNQNYMTNKLIKQTVDKNQKGYIEEEIEEEIKVIYSFISYGDEEGEIVWGEGTVEATDLDKPYAKVKVLTNTPEESFVGQTFYIQSDAKTDGTIYPLYSDAGETSVNIYVSIQETEQNQAE